MKTKTRKQFSRLTADVTPQRYALTLEPDLRTFSFAGEEVIDILFSKSASRLILHSKDLKITKAAFLDTNAPAIRTITYDQGAETVIFEFARRIDPGAYSFRIHFQGILNDTMRGFYRSSYRVGKETRYIATTQFEATDARRAFPCFDEPALKAVFEVALVVPKDKVAISNTIPVKVRSRADGKKLVIFAPTPKMSTYLLAFIVGDFKYIQKRTPEGVLVRVFTTSDKLHQGDFALKCAVKTLSFFNRYFEIPYPLPVLDMIAIPDFSSQAMENWGAVTYRESALLFDEEHSSTENKQWIALVVAHELAHQWFGNLVTMEWWTHLWLNEGFASYIEYLAVDHIFPKWRIWNRFVSVELGRALKLDALASSHPIEVKVNHPGEISEIFDDVSYRKGASVIRMLADYLGEETFRKGLSYYLKKHSYANTSTVHLWEAFEKVSRKPVVKMMRNWTGREGYPLITVKADRSIKVSQSRFFSSAHSAKASKGQSQWFVPIRAICPGHDGSESFMQLERSQDAFKPSRRSTDSLLKLNTGEVGVFRVNYPVEWWRAFADLVAENKLETRDRLGLLRDGFALAEAGQLSTPEALSFTRGYRSENEYVVWLEIAAAVNRVYGLIAAEPFAPAYRIFAREVFSEIATRMSWKHDPLDDHSDKILRSLALSQFGYYGDKATISKARGLFAGITAVSNGIPPDLRDAVYNLTAQYGGVKEHAKLLRLYRAATLHEERNRLGVALGRFQSQALLEQSLRFAISSQVRSQDTFGLLASVWLNPKGRDAAWAFFKRNWQLFLDRYQDGHTLPRIVSLAATFSSEAAARDVAAFFKIKGIPTGAERTLAQTLEEIRGRAAWIARDKAAIGKGLRRKRDD